MEELLQQLAKAGLDFDPQDPQFQRVLLANRASQRNMIMDRLRQSDAQSGFAFDEKAASDVADEEIFQNSLKQFLTESGQLPAMQQSDIARQTGERLRTEQDPTKAAALRGQLARLQRLSGLNLNQEEPVGGLEEFGRSTLGAAANLASSPGRFVGRHIGLGEDVAGLESELADIAPARITSPTGRFAGEVTGTAAPFAAATKLPLLARTGGTLGEMAGGLIARLGGRLLPSIARGLAPEVGGGAVSEALKAAARTAIPSAVGGATEFAVLDPAGTEQDPMKTLLMGALLGQGRTVSEAGRGSILGRMGQRNIPTSTLPEDLGGAGPLQEGNVLTFGKKNVEATDLLRNLSDEELAAQPLGSTPPLEQSGAAPGVQEAQVSQAARRMLERRGAEPVSMRKQTAMLKQFGERRMGQRRGLFDQVTIGEQPPATEPTEIQPNQAVRGYDLASQIDRELGGAREDLARTRIARIQRQLTEARDKRNALLLREHSTDLPEPQHEELLAMESHLESLMRDLENARESLRGGAPSRGAPFRALQEARKRVGRPKPRR